MTALKTAFREALSPRLMEKSLADQMGGSGRTEGNEIGSLAKWGRADYTIEINGQRFPIHSEIVGYQPSGDMKPIYQWFVFGSPHHNPSGRLKLGKAKTPRGVAGALKRVRYRIVKP